MDPKQKAIAKQKAERLGEILRQHRLAAGLSQAGLAELTEMSPSHVAYLERGRFPSVGIDKLTRLLIALELSADHVLAEAGYLPQRKPMTQPHSSLKRFLVERYKLSAADVALTENFVEFLKHKNRKRAG